jgi:hypothetical protein
VSVSEDQSGGGIRGFAELYRGITEWEQRMKAEGKAWTDENVAGLLDVLHKWDDKYNPHRLFPLGVRLSGGPLVTPPYEPASPMKTLKRLEEKLDVLTSEVQELAEQVAEMSSVCNKALNLFAGFVQGMNAARGGGAIT